MRLLNLFRRRPFQPAPPPAPVVHVPFKVEIVKTFDGYGLRQPGTDIWFWLGSDGANRYERWAPSDWDKAESRNFGRFCTRDLDVAKRIKEEQEQKSIKNAAWNNERAEIDRQRAAFVEEVVG